MKKIIPILLVLAGFLFISEHIQKQENVTGNADEKDFTVVDTYEEVKLYEQTTSGYGMEILKKAEQHGLIQTFDNKTIPVMGSKRTVQIHEAWSNNHEVYLLYSANLLLPDQNPKDVPYLDVGGLTLHHQNGKSIDIPADFYSTNEIENRTRYTNDGFVYNDRMYRSIWI
ncbi:hypothetical protein ACJROX_15750 [Pseudalkalibacillus sp. A8]|uniref:hypothetical protein n=1 Tax=Pseudalkalibacillus sp. A8 TaxID=3382641 RepID=UPI0038B56551